MMLIQIHVLLGVVWKISCAPNAFILIPEPKMWQEAQLFCRENHQDLATPQNPEDRSMIQRAAGDGDAWVGLYGGLNSWRWSYGDQEMGFTSWQYGEPSRAQTQDACTSITNAGLWSDISCGELRYFICYQVNNIISYHFIKTKMAWLNALQYCRKSHTDLVSIADFLGNLAVAAVVTSNLEWEAWIGLSRNTWLWSDGTEVSHDSMLWMETQPDNLHGSESCGYVRADGAVGDDVCSTTRPFFCTQIVKRQMLMVSVSADDNLAEVTVMAAVEEKINHVLSVKGMISKFNVTLRTYSEEILHDDITEESTDPCEEELSDV